MITIMTPTYNRGYILPNAYKSLKAQTSFEFEWIIVDDGSIDNTEEMVKTWLSEENLFNIIYIKQQNGGKHRAVNRGVLLASYDYFLILDSDDYLTENAVALIHKWIKDIEDLEGFAGVSGLKSEKGKVVGGNPKLKVVDATNLQRKKYGLLGDKAEIYKTQIMKKYSFPEFEGENFLSECASWDRIAKDGYKIRWYNEIIYICEYRDDGLTKNASNITYVKNFQGFTYNVKLYLETHSFFYKLNKCGHYYEVAKEKGLSKKEVSKLLNLSGLYITSGYLFFKSKRLIKNILKIK